MLIFDVRNFALNSNLYSNLERIWRNVIEITIFDIFRNFRDSNFFRCRVTRLLYFLEKKYFLDKIHVFFLVLISYLVVIVGNNFAQIFNFFALRTDRESKFVVRFFIFFNYFFELFVHITWLLQGSSENFIYRGLRLVGANYLGLFRLFLRPFLKKTFFLKNIFMDNF